MKKITGIKISRYDIGNGFFYEVHEDRDGFEAWIGLKDYGVMDFAIGVSKASNTREGFLDMLEWSAVEDIAFFLYEHDELEYSHPDLFDEYKEQIYFVSKRAEYCQERGALARKLIDNGNPIGSPVYEEAIADHRKAWEKAYAGAALF